MRIHIEPRLEEVKRLELLGALALHHGALPAALEARGVNRRVAVYGRKEEEGGRRIAGGTVCRRLDRQVGESPRRDGERPLRRHRRVVALAHPVLPLVRESIEGAAVHARHRVLERRVFPQVAVQLEDPPLPVARGEVAVEDAAHRIDEAAVGVRQVAQGRQLPADGHVTEHHLVPTVFARREVLGEPFGPPERQRRLTDAGVAVERLGGEADLEHMHQLVAERVAELAVAAPERQRHATLQELRDAQQPLGRNEGQDVRLLEVRMGGVDNERDTPRDGMIEAPLERVIALLGIGERHPPQLLGVGVIVEVDVLTAEHVPIEAPVLDLVLAEVAELGGERRGERERQTQDYTG